MDGILVPGGFGDRGIEGMIRAVRYARENKIPFFGICLGMQCAVIEYARDICGMKKANSTEFDETTPYPVIYLMPEQMSVEIKGGTMRLGKYPCKLYPGTLAEKAYGTDLISERHRHRYEVNNELRDQLFEKGLVLGGTLPNGKLVEIVELPTEVHPSVPGRTVPPRTEIPSHQSPSAVQGLHRCCPGLPEALSLKNARQKRKRAAFAVTRFFSLGFLVQ